MTIIIGASRINKIGSKLIQWWLGTKYSHVYASWELSSQERNIVYQASHGIVHFIEYNNFKRENEIVVEYKLSLTDEQFKLFSQKCIDLAGQPYSFMQLVEIFVSDLKKDTSMVSDRKGYICSELMSELLESLGFKFDKPKYLITPKDIIEKLGISNG